MPIFHLSEPSTIEITELVGQQLGPLISSAAGAAQLEAAGVNVLAIECESDGELCPAARKFQRELKKAPRLADSGATQVACLALARSACSNSAAMLGKDKWNGALRLQRLMVEYHGCSLLVPMGLAEIEIEGVEENVLPWARQLAAALEARGGATGGEAAGAAAATAAEIPPRPPPSGEPLQQAARPPPTSPISRVLLFSYEFTHSPFSGNGVLALTLTPALHDPKTLSLSLARSPQPHPCKPRPNQACWRAPSPRRCSSVASPCASSAAGRARAAQAPRPTCPFRSPR